MDWKRCHFVFVLQVDKCWLDDWILTSCTSPYIILRELSCHHPALCLHSSRGPCISPPPLFFLVCSCILNFDHLWLVLVCVFVTLYSSLGFWVIPGELALRSLDLLSCLSVIFLVAGCHIVYLFSPLEEFALHVYYTVKIFCKPHSEKNLSCLFCYHIFEKNLSWPFFFFFK